MHNWFSFLHKIMSVGAVSIGAVVASILPVKHHVQSVISPTPTITPTVVEKQILIDKTITEMGKQVTIHMQMPENGGALNGSISDDCQGTIDGTYVAAPQYHFNGKGDVTCTVGLLSLPASVTFTGNVHTISQTATIDYTITSGSNFSKTGNISVPYTK